jgi:hypothetical protein
MTLEENSRKIKVDIDLNSLLQELIRINPWIHEENPKFTIEIELPESRENWGLDGEGNPVPQD